MSRRYSEDPIQASIVEYLRAVAPHCRVYAIANGGFRNKREAARLKWTGVLAGVPDLGFVMPRGRHAFFEVKAPDGILGAAQKAFIADLIVLGHPYAVVRSIEHVRLALEQWGIETREVASVA